MHAYEPPPNTHPYLVPVPSPQMHPAADGPGGGAREDWEEERGRGRGELPDAEHLGWLLRLSCLRRRPGGGPVVVGGGSAAAARLSIGFVGGGEVWGRD